MFDVGDLVRVNYRGHRATHITSVMHEIPSPHDGKVGVVMGIELSTRTNTWPTVLIDNELLTFIDSVLEQVTS